MDPVNKEHKDPDTVDLIAPRLARYLQTAWKKHQNTVYWVDIKLAQKRGLKFYQTRSNANLLYLQHSSMPSLPFMWNVREVNAGTWIALVFSGTWWVEDTTRMLIADVVGLALRVYAGGA